MATRRALFGLSLLSLAVVGPIFGIDYHVGPGQALAAVGDVPWEALVAGDRIYIHWRAAAYQEKWVINAQGTAQAPILVSGVPGPGGERPVIDGRDATTRTELDYWNEARGIIKIGGSSIPGDGLPGYVVVENLEIRSGRPPFTFTDDAGTVQAYADNAASIYVEKAAHLVVRNCELHDSGNGLFVGAFDGQTEDVLIERSYIHDNGNGGSIFHHNTYTSSIGIVYQYNRFGPLRPGADGNNLKDRSAGLVVRYNWIEGGNRQLDLVEANDAPAISHPDYRATHVYGNVLIEPDGAGNSQIAHYGGDGGDPSQYRKGTLYFYNNTMVSTRSGNTTLLRLSTNDEAADVRNNILYVTAPGDRLAMLDAAGQLTLRHNWTKPGWVATHGTLTGTLDDDGSGVTGPAPGFVDEGTQDYHLASDSDAVDAGTVLHPDVLPDHPVMRQYLRHTQDEPRPLDPTLDIGAFEYCATNCALIFADGFESGNTSAWTTTVP
ncbi:MAG: polysaccharide-degrading enzyme [Acidobacteria bacterium]|nr:polysaccharide-degrading enzyme [Acidobacteriota bacterium]